MTNNKRTRKKASQLRLQSQLSNNGHTIRMATTAAALVGLKARKVGRWSLRQNRNLLIAVLGYAASASCSRYAPKSI